MGSSLETAIVFSTIFVIICFFIVVPLEFCGFAYNDFCDGCDELEDYYYDEYSAQDFNTFVVGISENYRLIYGSSEVFING